MCALLALFAASSLAAPGSYCSKEDLASYKSIAKAEIAAPAKKDVGSLLAAVEALALLKAPVTETEKLCEAASNGMQFNLIRFVVKEGCKTTNTRLQYL